MSNIEKKRLMGALKNIPITQREKERIVTTIFDNLGEGGSSKPKEFKFSIDGKFYNAIEGMTWGEWASSKYNTGYVAEDGTTYNIEAYDTVGFYIERDMWLTTYYYIATDASNYSTCVTSEDVITEFDYVYFKENDGIGGI